LAGGGVSFKEGVIKPTAKLLGTSIWESKRGQLWYSLGADENNPKKGGEAAPLTSEEGGTTRAEVSTEFRRKKEAHFIKGKRNSREGKAKEGEKHPSVEEIEKKEPFQKKDETVKKRPKPGRRGVPQATPVGLPVAKADS